MIDPSLVIQFKHNLLFLIYNSIKIPRGVPDDMESSTTNKIDTTKIRNDKSKLEPSLEFIN